MKTFKQVTESDGTLLIVDAINLGFRWKHSGAVDFAEDYIKTVESLKKSYKADKVIIACDKGSSSYRKGLSPEYKQNRKDKQALQTEAEAAAFALFFEEFERTMALIGEQQKYPVLRFQGVEADDICAYICSKVTNRNIWLISSDKDYDLLIRPGVSRFSYVTRKEVTIDNWNDHYEFNPEDYISIKCLTGDSGDNVAGVPGIGPKRAVSLVAEYGSTYDIVANIPLPGKYKYIQELNQCRDVLLLNYQLMDLVTHCREAIGEQNLAEIDQTLELYLK
jgi:5'-3' exonuclease